MLKKFLCAMSVAVLMFSFLGCGKQEVPETRELTEEYAMEYVLNLASYENIQVSVVKDSLDDETVEDYADFYYKELASQVEGLTDAEGNLLPFSDETVAMLGSEAFSTVSEFMVFTRKTAKEYIDEKFKRQVFEEAIEQVVEKSVFGEIDPAVLEGMKQYVFEDYSKLAAEYDMDVDTYVKYLETSVYELCEDYARLQAVCTLIAREQGIDTKDRDTMFSLVTDYIFSVTKTE